MTNEQTPRPRKKRTPDAAATPQADLDGVVDAAAEVVESAAAAMRDAIPEAEPLEVPIAGTAAADADALRASTAEAVEELEVEIRNSSAGQADARNAAAEALRLIRENLERLSPGGVEQVTQMLRQNVFNSDYLDPDFWRGVGMVLQYQVDEINQLVQRRLKGDYALDAYGMDQELIELVRPFAAFLYRTYWRVSAEGLENVPANGAALLVANRGGVLPWDSAMIATALLEEHPAARLARNLHETWLSGVPGMAPLLAAFGQVPALPENAARLLEAGELVVNYPEGARGAGKLFRNRYKLASFDAAAGFVQAALRTGAPIVPVGVIGSEETYPVLFDVRPLAKLIGLPYFPITPQFPLFGLFSFVPLPAKWTIIFDAPLATSGFGAGAADDAAQVARLTELVRARIQGLLDERGAASRPAFFGG
jgi:1-acyl-sn-glycerol-3-phosphate acyltransferase